MSLAIGRQLQAMERTMQALHAVVQTDPAKEHLPGYETGEDFRAWLEQVTPTWNWRHKHLELLESKLAAVTRGELRKLMVFMPPRHGKSQCTTVRYPVYRLERDLSTRVIIAAYNDELARKFSRDARRIAEGRIQLSTDRTAVNDWETAKGGGIRAVGVGSGVTGYGADLLLIDDPVKSREAAESLTERDRVWEWYRDDLITRLQPGAATVLIMTRWHDDDLAGRILASDDAPNWDVVSLPAFAEENDLLGRGRETCPRCDGSTVDLITNTQCKVCDGAGDVGEALCADLYPVRSLAEIKISQGRGFYALYQQAPRPREGATFKWEWFRKVAARPARIAQRIRYWDTAGSEGRGDYSAGVLMSVDRDGVFTIEDVVRGQWSPARKDQEILAAAQRDIAIGGAPYRIWLEQEAGIGGKERTEATIRALRGFIVRAEKITGSKEVRAEPLAAQAEVGNVQLMIGAWNRDFLEELCAFPQGRHDDQVDAASGALNKLSVPRMVASTFEFRI